MKKCYIAIALLLLSVSISLVYIKMFMASEMNEKKLDSEIMDGAEDSLEMDVLRNYLLEDHKKLIEEQSFIINLREFGDVSFLSCLPDYANGAKDKEDVTFYLAEDDIIYKFPSIYTDNLSPFWAEGVSYVSFEDINKDGLTDVIIGVDYITGVGAEGVIPFTMTRIFYSEGQEFIYGEELSDKINIVDAEKGIESILDYIGK